MITQQELEEWKNIVEPLKEEVEYLSSRLNDKNEELASAREVIEFYGNIYAWECSDFPEYFLLIRSEDVDKTKGRFHGGKRAREWLKRNEK